MDSTSYRRSAAAHASDAAAAEDECAWQGPITYDHCEALTFICPSTGCGNELKIRKAVEEQVIFQFWFFFAALFVFDFHLNLSGVDL